MKIKAKLKSRNTSDLYETNLKEEVQSNIEENIEDVVNANSPSLKEYYSVIYDGNSPSDCTATNLPISKKQQVFDIIELSTNTPKCSGYGFKGWEITTDGIKKINDDYFIMPSSDVIIKAKWSKLNLKMSMSGTVKEGHTLYKQIEQDYQKNNTYTKKYTGDTSTFKGNKDVYYYHGAATNNSVIFANYCWKIVRTTDTGGVKLLYNGVASASGTCNNTGNDAQLTDGEDITSAINKMINSDNINVNSSTVKSIIDYWYENNLIDYAKYLEDTVWCNDRSTLNLTSSSWSPTGSMDEDLNFSSMSPFVGEPPKTLACKYKIDRFTVNVKNGNGALKYPIALITGPEVSSARNESNAFIFNTNDYLTMTPQNQSLLSPSMVEVIHSGVTTTNAVYNASGVRPAISLIPDIEYISGNGTENSPYIIDLS